MSGNGHSISYKYNDSGIRTQKTVDGVTTNYRLVGDKVTYEDNGTDKIYYSYNASGNIVSMNLNGVEYYYIRNAQGDITGLFDGSGSQVVSYVYDSWGKLISIDGSLKDSVGVKNPYRYRGYRYDTETGMYYLQSRYYSPEWGRFINADGIIGQTGELLGHNLFIYSKNNPVNMSDSDGFRPEFSGTGHDTGDSSADSFAIMNKRYDYSTGTIRKPSSSTGVNTTGKTLKQTLVESGPGLASGTLYAMGENLGERANFGNVSTRLFGENWRIPVHLGTFEHSFKQLGTIGLLMSINDNIQYGVGIGLARSLIDVGGFVGTTALITAFAASGGLAAVGIGIGVGVVTEAFKWKATSILSNF